MIHLIYGENTTIIDEEILSIKTKFKDIPFEVIKKNLPLSECYTTCATIDMFTPKKGWIIYDQKWLKKCEKSELNILKNLLEFFYNENTPLIIVTKAIDKRSATYKALKSASVIELKCDMFKEWETDKMEKWLISYCKKNNIEIAPPLIKQLINGYGNNLGLIKQELQKLIITILPETTICKEDLIHSSSNSFGLYNRLSEGITTGNHILIIKCIHKLLELKEDPHKIINQILFQINNLLPISIGLKMQLSADNIAQKLKKHPFFIKKQLESLHKNKLKHFFPDLIKEIATLDAYLKQGKLSGKQALVRLSNTLKHQQ